MKTTVCFLIVLFPWFTYAQQSAWEGEEGEIDDTEVVIEKDREIALPPADRQFERVPPAEESTTPVDVSYRFEELKPQLPAISPKVRVLKVKEPPLDKLYGNYLKAGFGNFLTPYLDFYANTTRNDEYTYGLHVEHLSSRFGPVDDENSGNSHTAVNVDGKYFVKNSTLSGQIGYERNRYHFYGYQPGLEFDRDDIKQVFNIFSAQLAAERNQVDQPFDYRVSAGFRRISDDYEASENQIDATAGLSYQVNDKLSFGIKSDLWLSTRQDVSVALAAASKTNRNLFRLSPTVTLKTSDNAGRGLVFHAGFRAVYENDSAENADRLHLYPNLLAEYYVVDGFSLYAGVDGDIERRSLLSFVEENPFLGPDVPLLHTNRSLAFRGGLKGRFTSAVGFHAGFSLGNYRNLYFYANSATDSTKFTMLYDPTRVLLFNPFLELTFSSAERFRTTVRGDYFSYSVNNVDEPWHRPDTRLSILSSYNAYDKLLFSAELLLMGGIQGINLANDNERALDTITDLSFQADYLFSSRFSVFLQLKNILAQNYERFLNYPSRGIMVMGGASYSF